MLQKISEIQFDICILLCCKQCDPCDMHSHNRTISINRFPLGLCAAFLNAN